MPAVSPRLPYSYPPNSYDDHMTIPSAGIAITSVLRKPNPPFQTPQTPFLKTLAGFGATATMSAPPFRTVAARPKRIVYLTPGLDLPFWRYPSRRGSAAAARGYECQRWTPRNSAQIQLNNAQDAIARGMAGLVISPTDSSTAPSVLTRPAPRKSPSSSPTSAPMRANTFVSADNYVGAYDVGKALATGLRERGWQDSAFGISAISQARKNGQARTRGFLDGLRRRRAGRQASLHRCRPTRPKKPSATPRTCWRPIPIYARFRSDRPADDRRCAP